MSGPIDPTLPSASGADTEVHAEEAYCSACNQSFPSGTKICPNDGARLIKLAAERDELIGRVLDERYEIRAPLGKGGMGTVYRGWQLSVDREVAIKVIHPKLSNDRSVVKRFLREARLASRLSQPNIVNVYDFGQSNGVLYLVMELLRGHTLASELGDARRLNAQRTILIASQLCDALEAAHAQGIVHRDLKPSNIMILDDPPGRDLIKVLDFGLAKSLIQDSGSVVTNTDALLGTPLYMAPEQIEGRVSDERADLYSLGCMVYEMLSGKPPFVDNSVSIILARHMNDTPQQLPQPVPPRLRTLVDQLLAKAPEQRVQTAGEVHRLLAQARDSMVVAGSQTPLALDVPDTVPDIAHALAETGTMPPAGMRASPAYPEATLSPPPARSRRLAFLALFAAIPLGIGTFFAVRSRTAREPEPAHQPVAAPPAESLPPPDAAVNAATEPPQPPPATIDAGVEAVATPVDAGDKKRPVRSERGRRSKQPAGTIDAGTPSQTLPDIDFIDVKKK